MAHPDHRAIGVIGTWRGETRFALWSAAAWIKHLIGLHTMIYLEEWDQGTIRFLGRICWGCPRQEP